MGGERGWRRAGLAVQLSMDKEVMENVMAEPMRKDEAHELVDRMAEGATWDDLIDQIYVREVIEQGLADSQAGRTTDVQQVRRKYGLQP
jgi:hypothetical protein